MRKLLLLGLVLALLAGCKKANPTNSSGAPAPQASSTPAPNPAAPPPGPSTTVIHAGPPTGGVYQGVRMAGKRVVAESDLKQIQIFIENASLASGQMPTREEVAAALQKEAPKIYKQVQEGAIVLTGTRSRQNIWAYTPDPQSIAGYHLILTSNGVERLDPAPLKKRLEQEKGT